MDQEQNSLDEFFQFIQNPIVQRFLSILIGALVIFVIARFVKSAINKKVKSADGRYRARKTVSLASYVFLVILLMFIFSDKLGNVGVALGVAGAGIAFAFQEVIVSVTGLLLSYDI